MSPAAVPPGGLPGARGRGLRSREARGPDVRIGRLALRVTGLDEEAARTLAGLVAEELPSRLTGPDAGRVTGDQHLGRVRIQVTADAAEQGQPDLLARRIAGELARILAGMSGEAGS